MSIFFRLDWVTLTLSQIRANTKNLHSLFPIWERYIWHNSSAICFSLFGCYDRLCIDIFPKFIDFFMKNIQVVTAYREFKECERQIEETKGWYVSIFFLPWFKYWMLTYFFIDQHDSFAKREWWWPWYGWDDSFRARVSLWSACGARGKTDGRYASYFLFILVEVLLIALTFSC